MTRVSLFYRLMKPAIFLIAIFSLASRLSAQIQVELKLPRLQFIAYEPITATLHITNLAGRDVDLHDSGEQAWFGFEVTGKEGQPIGPIDVKNVQPPLKIEAGKRVIQKINLTPLFPVNDFGTYHVRAHVYFGDLNKFFYSTTKVFQVTDARAIWQRTVGMPDGASGPGNVRTYSLMSNRFSDHTSIYVRVADGDRGVVFATYSLGRIIAYLAPQAEIDRTNQLHVLHCAAPRSWTYSRVGLNGELLSHSSFMETKTRPRLIHDTNGVVAVRGGMMEEPAAVSAAATAAAAVPKLSERPAEMPKDN